MTNRCCSARRPCCIRRTSTYRRPSRPMFVRQVHNDPEYPGIQHTCDCQHLHTRPASGLLNVSAAPASHLTYTLSQKWPRAIYFIIFYSYTVYVCFSFPSSPYRPSYVPNLPEHIANCKVGHFLETQFTRCFTKSSSFHRKAYSQLTCYGALSYNYYYYKRKKL